MSQRVRNSEETKKKSQKENKKPMFGTQAKKKQLIDTLQDLGDKRNKQQGHDRVDKVSFLRRYRL